MSIQHNLTQEEVLKMKTARQLAGLLEGDFSERPVTIEEFVHMATVLDAYWRHPGAKSPKAPHAVTVEGLCTNGFIDTLAVLAYPNLRRIFARQMERVVVRHLRETNVGKTLDLWKMRPFYWVIGSAYASIQFSGDVAYRLSATRSGFMERGEGKEQLWTRFPIKEDETVLQVEELVTTAATLRRVREGIRRGNQVLGGATNISFAPFSASLVHRSTETEFEGGPILYCYHFDIATWKPEDCPLCTAGSERIEKPKKKGNWARLTAP